MEINYYICQYCEKKFKKESYLSKHQKNTKYCLTIQQKKDDEKELENTIQNLQNAKAGLNNEIMDIIVDNHDEIISNKTDDLEKIMIDEVHDAFLEFENKKILAEDEYNTKLSLLLNNNLKNNMGEYYDTEKNKINKLQEMYLLFEKKKADIEEKYSNLILQEEQKYDNTWKEELKKEKIIDLENKFNSCRDKIINLIDEAEDIDDIKDSLNNVFVDTNKEQKDDQPYNKNLVPVSHNIPCKSYKIKSIDEDMENKLLYHLVVLLQDQQINTDTLMYIIVELMRFMNNYDIKGEDKKSYILYILEKFIDTNEDYIENKEDIKKFIYTFSNEFINITSAISDKKLRIKVKKSCFFPLCF
jgi:hypothetical protein